MKQHAQGLMTTICLTTSLNVVQVL